MPRCRQRPNMPAHPAPDYIASARRELAERDPALALAQAQTPLFAWRSRNGGFEGLFRMIVEQQVSVVAAAAIWSRVVQGLDGEVTPRSVLAQEAETLRGF